MKTDELWFTGPGEVAVRERQLPPPGPGEIRVRSLYGGISSGTEMLAYRGQLPPGALDDGLDALAGRTTDYPLRYGYATVGIVEELGRDVDGALQGETVFAFQPHATHFNVRADSVIVVPEDLDADLAVLIANMETAVNLLQDGAPRLGEQVVVFGLGVVGLLAAKLLAQFPLGGLYGLDRLARRCICFPARSGADRPVSGDPASAEVVDKIRAALAPSAGADLVYELSGNPEALNQAIDLCGYGGRIVVGSWYGSKSAAIDLGGKFHRQRLSLVSSQVSSVAPELSGRWDKTRRFDTVLEMLRRLQPHDLITHRIPFGEATRAYELIDESPENCLQVVLTY